MHFTTLLFFLTTTIFANPAPAFAKPPTETRHHQFCQDFGYGGICEQIAVTYNQCTNFNDNLSKQLSSFRIPNDEACTLFTDRDCPNDGEKITHMGDQGYLTGCGGCAGGKFCWHGCGNFWNDKAMSVKCVWPNPLP